MVKKSEFIWNSISSVVASMLSAVLLLFCTRINGTVAAGIFSIAFATSVILNAIGDYGIRVYQVTDVNRKYKFGEYLALRIVVVTIMFLIGVIFVFVSGYELEKLIICLLLILFRVIDNLSETYQGEFQIQGRLDIGGKSVVIRNILAMIAFLITDIITKNMIVSTLVLFFTNLGLFVLYDLNKIKKFTSDKIDFNTSSLKILLKECFPICISTLLSLYITNAVKYAIDGIGDYDMQTYYNIIYLPTFTINLASLFIVKPMFKTFGEYWNNGKIKELIKILAILILLIIVVTILIEVVCMFLGIPILNLIYGVDLNSYKIDLLILVLSGCFYSISVLMLYVSTTIRKQKYTTAIYIIVSIIALIISNILVSNMGMRGASISNVIITIVLATLLSVVNIKEIYAKNKKNKIIEK